MKRYPFLSELPLARSNDPETSKAAAVKMVESGALNRQENEIFFVIDTLYTGNDFTTKDIAALMLGYPYYKAYVICGKRFSDLERKGKIELIQTGVKVTYTKSIPSLRIEKPIYKRRDGCRVWRLK